MEESFSLHNRYIYENTNGIDLLISPTSVDDVEEYELCIVQTSENCKARFLVEPKPNTKSKIKIYIYAENKATVDCVCTLRVPKDVSGVETDVQIRSWPFDRSKIQARPEMFIENSNIVATHGNAIGTAFDRYYLESKGIVNVKTLIKESLLDA